MKKGKKIKKGYSKCWECGLYVLSVASSPPDACPRCRHGWEKPEDFGWIKLRNYYDTIQHCNYWIVNVNAYSDTWGWIATTWLRNGECLQIKKLNMKSFAGCKASWTLFAKKHKIVFFEFE
jgi:hypothetical protein